MYAHCIVRKECELSWNGKLTLTVTTCKCFAITSIANHKVHRWKNIKISIEKNIWLFFGCPMFKYRNVYNVKTMTWQDCGPWPHPSGSCWIRGDRGSWTQRWRFQQHLRPCRECIKVAKQLLEPFERFQGSAWKQHTAARTISEVLERSWKQQTAARTIWEVLRSNPLRGSKEQPFERF